MPTGLPLVNANTLAAASGSANVLNSATGVMLPGCEIAPLITTTSFTRRKTSGSWAAASAILVSGPMATMEMVLGGFDARSRRISRCEGRDDGVKSLGGGSEEVEGRKCSFHVSKGERWGCCRS